MVKGCRRTPSKYDIINIWKKDKNNIRVPKNEHGEVSSTTNEAKREKEAAKFVKPHPSSLLQPIQRFFELAHMMMEIRVNKSLWFSHVDILI